MKIVFFAHPLFLNSQSMPRFVNMLAEGMESRGHETEVWRPEALFSKIFVPGLKKWLGYIDQYMVFPLQVRRKINLKNKDVLYVITDQALGPYVPLVEDKPHVIHCHDFLAQRSALGEIPENVTSFSGRKYQDYIRKGYVKGRNFISVSEKTRRDLEAFLPAKPLRSEMVYNGLNPSFRPIPVAFCRSGLGRKLKVDLSNGYILHVGGNQWYKNRKGVIAIYDKWREVYGGNLPLLLIGQPPSGALLEKQDRSAYKTDIYFFSQVDDDTMGLAYAGASVFLFPSIAEGFGWPIAEAMASGTVVITTNEAPMLEVAGDAALLIDRMPSAVAEEVGWAKRAAGVLQKAINLDETARENWTVRSSINIQRFELKNALDRIEGIYNRIMETGVKI
jgi:glycosyltransferase involved in cell wall biosynthesis